MSCWYHTWHSVFSWIYVSLKDTSHIKQKDWYTHDISNFGQKNCPKFYCIWESLYVLSIHYWGGAGTRRMMETLIILAPRGWTLCFYIGVAPTWVHKKGINWKIPIHHVFRENIWEIVMMFVKRHQYTIKIDVPCWLEQYPWLVMYIMWSITTTRTQKNDWGFWLKPVVKCTDD